MERAVIIVEGRVQKAGYRDFIDETAFNLDLTGRVKNMEDGSVEVVCEGTRKKIQEFVEKIQIKKYPIKVESIDVKYSKATGEYNAFEIVRDEDLTNAVYDRMDTAARYMREMGQDLGGRVDNLGGKIDGLGGKMDKGFSEVNHSVTQVNDSVSSLDDNICNNFEHLDRKYDKISDRMEKMDKTLEKLADAILKLAKK